MALAAFNVLRIDRNTKLLETIKHPLLKRNINKF